MVSLSEIPELVEGSPMDECPITEVLRAPLREVDCVFKSHYFSV